jgi:thioredoxin-related protein
MKKTHVAITLLLTVFWVAVSCSKSSEQENGAAGNASGEKIEVAWKDFNSGIKLAREQKKPIVMDFYADWCGWCRKMEAEVFTDKEVGEKLKKNFICIRIHTDRDLGEAINFKDHALTKQEFATMLGVQGLPTIVFMDRDAGLITKIPGFVNKNVFLSLLGYIQEGCYQKKVPFQDYMDGKVPCGK